MRVIVNLRWFPPGWGPGAWHSVVEDCCIGCTDLNFSFCSTPCKVLVDNGGGRRQIAAEPVGSTSQFASVSFSAAQTRSADDFVISQFTQGPATMFPTWVFGSTRVGIPPHVFAFATIIFVTGATLALALARNLPVHLANQRAT